MTQSPWEKQIHSSLLPPSIHDHSSRTPSHTPAVNPLGKEVCVCCYADNGWKACKRGKATESRIESGERVNPERSERCLCLSFVFSSVSSLSLSLPEAHPSALALLLTVLLWENKEMEKRGGEPPTNPSPPHSPVARVERYFPFTESTARLCSDLCESMCVLLNLVGHKPSP